MSIGSCSWTAKVRVSTERGNYWCTYSNPWHEYHGLNEPNMADYSRKLLITMLLQLDTLLTPETAILPSYRE